MSVLIKLFVTFFEIGLTSFGGGYAMIPLVQAYTVGNGWLSIMEVTDMVAISEMTPGPFAINIATFTGIKTAGIPGAIAATVGVIAPSFFIIIAIAIFFHNAQNNPNVQGVLSGIRPVVIGLIATAAYSIGQTSILPNGFSGGINVVSVIFSIAVFIAIRKFKLNPILAILASGLVGILLYTVFGFTF